MNDAGESALSTAQLRLLLVESRKPRPSYLQSLLAHACGDLVSFDHARSPEDALARLTSAHHDLVLCDYNPGDGAALRLLRDLRHLGVTVPFIFLSDHVDEKVIAQSVAAACSRHHSSRSSTAQALCEAINDYCRRSRCEKSDDMLRKLWHAVEQTADLVVITDREGLIEYVNPAFEKLTGYSREEAAGQTLRILKSSQQPIELYRELWETIVAGETFRGVITNQKKDGQLFLAEKTITPLRDTKGQITHFVSTDRDITERHRLEGQLQQAQRMDAIGRLAGGVAHDFNNLLMVISSYAELMLDSITPQHPLRRNVEEIMTASARAADLTRQLLAFGRKQMQALRVLDLNSVMHDISRMLPRLIGEDVQLVIVPGKDLGRVKADPVQIEQVVMNLAANARDAMPRGGRLVFETANVVLDEAYLQRRSIVPPGDYVQLAVTDSGNGIAAEHLPHIFEPFYTTKEEGKGTGLGLATVYGIVKQNSGYVWVYSEPGLGTTFKIYLPRVEGQSHKPAFSLPVEPAVHGSETLLLVEDESAVRQSAREFLESSGYTVLEAHNGEEALQVGQNSCRHDSPHDHRRRHAANGGRQLSGAISGRKTCHEGTVRFRLRGEHRVAAWPH